VNPEDLHPASYREVPFLFLSSSIGGGRKTVKKQFVDSNRQLIEDLGQQQREFTISGIVAARREKNAVVPYVSARDTLLEALEKRGPGVLVHPFYGRLEDISCVSYTLNEDTARLGEADVSITFSVSNTLGLPEQQETVVGEVVEHTSFVVSSVTSDVPDRFEVTNSFLGNFTDAVNKVSSVASAIEEAMNPAAILASELDEVTHELNEMIADVASLVSTPTDLVDSITNLFDIMNGAYATVVATFDALVRLFSFGDDDVPFDQNTLGRVERQVNRDVVNATVRALALGYAYENAVKLEFENTSEIDATWKVLEDEYQDLTAAEILSSSVEEELAKQRIAASSYFDELRVTKPRVITVSTELTSTRLLSYRYYGSSELGTTLAKMNGLLDSALVEGSVEVLTA
jgi:prophage DNA circulation protein